MIRHHIAGKPDPKSPGLIAQPVVRIVTAKIVGNPVIVKRIGGRNSILFAAQMFDRTRGAAPLSKSDEPKRIHAAGGQRCKLFVRYLIEPRDRSAVPLAQLRKPYVRALRNQYCAWHPILVRTESFVLVLQHGKVRQVDASAKVARMSSS